MPREEASTPSLQPVAVGADDGGNDIGLKHSDDKGRLGRLSDHAGCNASKRYMRYSAYSVLCAPSRYAL